MSSWAHEPMRKSPIWTRSSDRAWFPRKGTTKYVIRLWSLIKRLNRRRDGAPSSKNLSRFARVVRFPKRNTDSGYSRNEKINAERRNRSLFRIRVSPLTWENQHCSHPGAHSDRIRGRTGWLAKKSSWSSADRLLGVQVSSCSAKREATSA